MAQQNIIKEKSFLFAIEIIHLANELRNNDKEFILSKQLYKSGTSIGACVREAEFAESNLDFIHKFSIALKEANETIYWLELVANVFPSKSEKVTGLIKENAAIKNILTAIIKSCKSKKKTISKT
ncbi:MAG: four helix bundle protein [Chitinophagales bacterium]|jgi:four helix bundle protein|nr:four helix bundle protein [Chitinophagales bacterium]